MAVSRRLSRNVQGWGKKRKKKARRKKFLSWKVREKKVSRASHGRHFSSHIYSLKNQNVSSAWLIQSVNQCLGGMLSLFFCLKILAEKVLAQFLREREEWRTRCEEKIKTQSFHRRDEVFPTYALNWKLHFRTQNMVLHENYDGSVLSNGRSCQLSFNNLFIFTFRRHSRIYLLSRKMIGTTGTDVHSNYSRRRATKLCNSSS